jgi:hypothetical protein
MSEEVSRDRVLEGLDASRRAGWARAYKAEERVRLLEEDLKHHRERLWAPVVWTAALKWLTGFVAGPTSDLRTVAGSVFRQIAAGLLPLADVDAADDAGRTWAEGLYETFEKRCPDCRGLYTDTCRHDGQTTPEATVERTVEKQRDRLKYAFAALVALGELARTGAPRWLLACRAGEWASQLLDTDEEERDGQQAAREWVAYEFEDTEWWAMHCDDGRHDGEANGVGMAAMPLTDQRPLASVDAKRRLFRQLSRELTAYGLEESVEVRIVIRDPRGGPDTTALVIPPVVAAAEARR